MIDSELVHIFPIARGGARLFGELLLHLAACIRNLSVSRLLRFLVAMLLLIGSTTRRWLSRRQRTTSSCSHLPAERVLLLMHKQLILVRHRVLVRSGILSGVRHATSNITRHATRRTRRKRRLRTRMDRGNGRHRV